MAIKKTFLLLIICKYSYVHISAGCPWSWRYSEMAWHSAAENLEDPNCVLHTADCSEEVEMSHLSSPVNDKVYFKNLKIKTAFNTWFLRIISSRHCYFRVWQIVRTKTMSSGAIGEISGSIVRPKINRNTSLWIRNLSGSITFCLTQMFGNQTFYIW